MNKFSHMTSAGADGFDALSMAADPKHRKDVWNKLLIDNQDGDIINSEGTVRYEDHKRMLDTVLDKREYTPMVFDTLIARPGISQAVSINETLIGYQNLNDFEAHTSMEVSNRTSNQTDYDYKWTPLPIYHSDFHIPLRQGFGYKQADSARLASKYVRLERERVLIEGDAGIKVNGYALEGLTNAAATLSLAGSLSDWADPSNSNVIYKEANGIIQAMFNNRAAQAPDSLLFVVANDIKTNLNLDYADQKGDRTIRERILAIEEVGGLISSQFLPDGAVLVLEMTSEAIVIPKAMDITLMPWMRVDQMSPQKFTVAASSTLQVREDRAGRGGVAYATKA